jgi:uncharacterized membrane protein YphA (DoxX/SURF4 family)
VKNVKEKSYKILFFGRVLIGLVFAYSGYTKLMEPVENFQAAVAAYEIIPYMAVPLIAHVMPWLELVFGALVLAGYMTRLSSLILSAMSFSFVLLILITRFKTGSFPADCGCFGEGSLVHFTGWQVLILDTVNTVIGLKLFFTQIHPVSLDALLTPKAARV